MSSETPRILSDKSSSGAEGLGLACRLGRHFCFAEVSTGDPHPSTRSACLGFEPFTLNEKENDHLLVIVSFWQGQKVTPVSRAASSSAVASQQHPPRISELKTIH